MNLLKTVLLLWAQYREFRTELARLAARSDRDLRDLGVARGDIARLAYTTAERRISPFPARSTRAARPMPSGLLSSPTG